ncbi:MAG: DUF1553 domain-containing protein [Thermoguttaceae bacterium]|jgi:hypothetical protein|nr:DUF1553 domain-containing protein [Thermoguttaceae bacterium]
MMKKAFAVSAVLLLTFAGWAGLAANDVFESPVPPEPAGELDKIVMAKLATMDIKPVLCSDAVFMRRVYLDVIGTLPTADEVREFLADESADKRSKLIDRLIDRSEFADYWSMKWGDILRIKAEIPVNLWPNAAQAFHRWIRASLAENMPYNQFVREMLTASGSNFHVGQVNFYRAIQDKTPEGTASTVALTFMGSRTDNWPEGRLAGTAVFFSQISRKPTSEWKEEIVFWDPLQVATVPGNAVIGREKPGTGERPKSYYKEEDDSEDVPTLPPPREQLTAVFPDGTKVELPPDRDPREIFADWLITPENPWFTKTIVNRVWAWLLGRGIIHEPDDIRDDNPPSNPELLAYLEKELIDSGYDLRHLYRLILNSSTYQFSAMPRNTTPEAQANFASYLPRRLDAEVLIDALNQITGTTDLYTSATPEPYTYIPREMPAIALADGSVTSQFLALFGRSARATGMASERSNEPVPSQWLHLLNSSHIQNKLAAGPKMKAILESGKPLEQIVEELYLTILSRRPTEEELNAAKEYVGAAKSKREGHVDIAWALINTTEFLYRH